MPPLRLSRLLMMLALMLAAPSLVLAQETPALPLTATYTSADGTLSFAYPGGWAAADAGRSAVLATRESVLEADADLPRGEMRADIYAAPIESLPGLDAGDTLEDVMEVAVNAGTTATTCEPYTEPVAITVQGRDALRADQTCAGTESVLIVVALPDDAAAVIGGSTLLGSMSKFAATLVAIGGTVTYTAPNNDLVLDLNSLRGTFTSEDGRLTLRVPRDWQVEEQDGLIGMSNGDAPIFPEPPAGQLLVLLRVLDTSDIPPEFTTASGVIQMVINDADPAFREPVTLQVGPYEVAQTSLRTTDAEVLILATEVVDGTFVLLSALAAPGQLNTVAPQLYAIAATMDYDARATTVASSSTETTIAIDDVTLTQTYRDPDQTFSFQYPPGWHVYEEAVEGGMLIFIGPGTEFALAIPESGEPFGVLRLVVVEEANGAPPVEDEQQRTLDAIEVIRDEIQLPYGPAMPLVIDGITAARMDSTVPDYDSTSLLVLLGGSVYTSLNVFSASGELDEYLPTYAAIAASVALSDPTIAAAPTLAPTAAATPLPVSTPVPLDVNLSETFTSEDGSLTFGYPAGWNVDDSGGLLTLSNVEELTILASEDDYQVESGQYRIVLTVQPASDSLADMLTQESAEFMEVGDPVAFSLGGHEAMRAPIDILVMSGSLVIVQLPDDQVAVITAFHAPDDYEALESLLDAVVGSIEVGA